MSEAIYQELVEKSKKLPRVRSHDDFANFNIDTIIDSLMLETKMNRKTAIDITAEVVNSLISSNLRYLTGGIIREICMGAMADKGMEEQMMLYRRVGIPMYDIGQIIENPSRYNSNANLLKNPETIAKIIHDEVAEEYTLLRMPRKAGDAHLRGDIYIKDRDYFYTRDYCASWPLTIFLKNGLAPDGLGGVHSSYAKPAKHAIVAVNHAAIWLAAAQCNFAGGQGFYYFNTYLAPYMRGLPEKEIRQCAQHFVFIMTQQYVARGGQIIFSSIDLSPGVPKILRDVPAIKPGGIVGPETYGDYEAETKALFDAFMKVFLEGDGRGKLFNYPKPNLILREEFMKPEFESSWMLAAELTAKYGLPYFENYLNWRKDIEAGCSSCCSHLWVADGPEELELFKTGNMVFGASQMVTPNFPRIAWLTKQFGDSKQDYFFDKLSEYLNLAKVVFLEKRKAVQVIIDNQNAPFYTQPRPDGKPLVDLHDRLYLIGTVGFNEMCEIMTDSPLHEPKGYEFALKVLRWLKNKCVEMSKETGLKIDVTRTPAESAAGRLAMKDYKAYPGIRKYLKGDADNPYYTNSVAVAVDADVQLIDRVKIEGMFHPFLTGGALTHIYLGDRGDISPKVMWDLILKIARNTLNSYFAFTRDLAVCSTCGFSGSLGSTMQITDDFRAICPKCGNKAEVYSRITGYLQSLHTWNAAKKREFLDRKRYIVGD